MASFAVAAAAEVAAVEVAWKGGCESAGNARGGAGGWPAGFAAAAAAEVAAVEVAVGAALLFGGGILVEG